MFSWFSLSNVRFAEVIRGGLDHIQRECLPQDTVPARAARIELSHDPSRRGQRSLQAAPGAHVDATRRARLRDFPSTEFLTRISRIGHIQPETSVPADTILRAQLAASSGGRSRQLWRPKMQRG